MKKIILISLLLMFGCDGKKNPAVSDPSICSDGLVYYNNQCLQLIEALQGVWKVNYAEMHQTLTSQSHFTCTDEYIPITNGNVPEIDFTFTYENENCHTITMSAYQSNMWIILDQNSIGIYTSSIYDNYESNSSYDNNCDGTINDCMQKTRSGALNTIVEGEFSVSFDQQSIYTYELTGKEILNGTHSNYYCDT